MKERPELDPEITAAAFVDFWHAQPGAKGRKTDWTATWRNWVRNQRAPMNGAARRSPLHADNIFEGAR